MTALKTNCSNIFLIIKIYNTLQKSGISKIVLFFFKEINTFMQPRHFKLIENDNIL